MHMGVQYATAMAKCWPPRAGFCGRQPQPDRAVKTPNPLQQNYALADLTMYYFEKYGKEGEEAIGCVSVIILLVFCGGWQAATS
jgi:hypothetical protein